MSEDHNAATGELFFGAPSDVLIPYNSVLPSRPTDGIKEEEADEDYIAEIDKSSNQNPFRGTDSKKRPAADEVLPTKRQKRYKMGTAVKGGHAPSFKPITVDLDEEDQLIVDMKQQGYSNDDIVVRLVEKGLTRYEAGSVACRWLRIRKKTQEYEEKLLDEELTDWHIGEDEMLEEAYKIADQKFQIELGKLEQKRWSWVAQEINKRLPRQRFSAKACQKRWKDHETGEARCPPELDSDPEGRALEREERITAYKLRKKEEAEREAAEAESKKRFKKDNTAQKIAARQRREAQSALKAQKKREKEEYRQSMHNAIALAKLRKQNGLDAARAERLYNEKKNQFFVRLHKQLRKEVGALQRKKEQNGGVTPDPEEVDVVHKRKSRYTYKNTADQIADEDFDATEAAINARAQNFTGVVEPVGTVATQTMPMSKPAASISALQQPPITTDGFPEDPRSYCTIDELHNILRSRGMLLNRMKENKPIILSRLNNEDNAISIQQLRDLLNARNEDSSGTKAEMMRRLAIADAKSSRKYQNTRTNRPLDEDGNPIRVKMPAKPAVTKTSTRYNARDVVMKNGVAVTNTESSTANKKAPIKKTPAKPATKKTPAKPKKTPNKRKSATASKQFIPDDDDEEDDDNEEPGPLHHAEVDGQMQDVVSSLLSED